MPSRLLRCLMFPCPAAVHICREVLACLREKEATTRTYPMPMLPLSTAMIVPGPVMVNVIGVAAVPVIAVPGRRDGLQVESGPPGRMPDLDDTAQVRTHRRWCAIVAGRNIIWRFQCTRIDS